MATYLGGCLGLGTYGDGFTACLRYEGWVLDGWIYVQTDVQQNN